MTAGAALGIRPATLDDRLPIAQTLAAAFGAGPVARWLIPDPGLRRAVYLEYSRLGYDQALAHGQVQTTAGWVGAAIWYPYPLAVQPADTNDVTMLLGEAARRFGYLEQAIAARIPALPHHYLAYLGVRPAHQGRGVGSALLHHHHRELDASGRPAFLVATSVRGRDLYLRHGYLVVEEFALPAGPPLWSMWREPR